MSTEVSGLDGFLAYAALAKSGELVLDPEVAGDCAAACTTAIAELHAVRERMNQQTGRLPLGDFACGDDLAVILSDVTRQFVQRLDEHIACLGAIHDMVGAQVAECITSDAATAEALARVGGAISR